MRRGLITVLALAALGAFAPAAEAGRAWGPPQPLVGQQWHTPVDAAYTPRGGLVAVWQEGSGMVAFSRAPGASRLTEEAKLPSGPGPGSIAATPQGEIVYGWNPSGLNGSYVAIRDPRGTWRSRYVEDAGSSAYVAAGAGGHAVFVGRGQAWGDTSPLVLSYRAPGGGFGPAEPIPGVTRQSVAGTPQAAVLPDGTVAVVWRIRLEDNRLVAQAVLRRPDGSYTPVQTLTPPGLWGSEPTVVADTAGNAVAAWADGRAWSGAPGRLQVARLIRGCCFAASRDAGTATFRGFPMLRALEPGVAALLTDTPDVTGVFMTTGALTPSQPIGPAQDLRAVAGNPAGHAAAILADRSGLQVSRRLPGQGFQRTVGAVCGDRVQWRVSGAAMSPRGNLSVFFHDPDRQTMFLVEDAPAARDSDCRPLSARRGRLALQARMPRGGKLVSGRWLGLRVSCGVACRLRVTGKLKVAGRRRWIPLTEATARRPRAGTTSVRIGMTRSRRAAVRRALARRRAVRAVVRVRASGGGSSRTLTFRVRVRRR